MERVCDRAIERDLHDGAQQRLVLLALQLRTAQAAVPPELAVLNAELSRSAEGLANVLEELREIARGTHPAILAEGGLGAALEDARPPLPGPGRPRRAHCGDLDAFGHSHLFYYAVSEMLTNAARHAHASHVQVDVVAVDGVLRVSVQ